MSVPLDEFVKQLEESGVLASDTIRDLVPPKDPPQNAEELAATLVARKKLTEYQAERIFHGKGRALVLGNYTILEEIGAGGMGQVFKAEHRRMHRIVAVKVLARSKVKDAAAAARFEREVTVAARLNHPNIVTAFDADFVGGNHLLVMEYVDGSDLWALVKKNGPLPVAEALDCVLQAARGLEAAHAAGILHRDIKPSNLILDRSGKVKVVDLGLASLSLEAESEQQAPLTEDGAVLGTADFMPPEQACDSRAADARSDVYSLGCTLYFLLTGQVVYPVGTRMQKMLAHREQPIPSLRALRPEVPGEVEKIFRKMVAKRVEDRQQSMTAVIDDLERLPKGGAAAVTRQRPAAAATLERKWLGRSLICGLILVAGVALILWTRNSGDVDRAEKPSRGPSRESAPSSAAQSHERAPQGEREAADGGPLVAGNVPLSKELWDLPFEKWLERVADLPADEQVAAVALKLKELNPDFDAKLEPEIENGQVTKLEFQADDLHDVSPVQALRSLKGLFCYRTAGKKGDFADLSPLRELPLENLYCGLSAVADLSPLKDMQLSFLNIGVTNVRDLSPLSGMRLRSLDVGATPVSSLAPLTGMPLEYLNCSATRVTDLSPLEGMPLKELRCDFLRERDTAILHSIPTLEKINGKPVAEFWADVENEKEPE